jgi:hypothetical protein
MRHLNTNQILTCVKRKSLCDTGTNYGNIQYLDSGFLDELETAVRSAGDEPGVKVASGKATFVHSAQSVHILTNSGKELPTIRSRREVTNRAK